MPHGLFDKSLYQFDTPQPSYWEESAGTSPVAGTLLTGHHSCDVAIIGGGYTGTSAALHLARDFGIDVRVLEAGHFGWGASGRNGGFCTIGGTKLKPKALIKRYGKEEARRFYQSQTDAVELVRTLGNDENIDYQIQGNGEYTVAESDAHYRALAETTRIKRDVLGLDVSMISKDTFREVGYDAPHQHGAMEIKPSFGLHPLRFIHGLAAAAERRGAHLHPHSTVMSWHKANGLHVLNTEAGSLSARRVIVAGNGFMPEHLSHQLRGRAIPIQSAIIVTRPLTGDERAMHVWTTENPAVNSFNVYVYYRLLPDNRLMMGGRADFKGTPDGAQRTADGLARNVARMWPAWKNVEVEYSWRGLVCFSSRLTPQIGRFPDDPSVMFGFGYHGTGVNTATWTGRELAYWLAGANSGDSPVPDHLPAPVRGFSPRVPLPGLRKQYVHAGIAWQRLRDRLG